MRCLIFILSLMMAGSYAEPKKDAIESLLQSFAADGGNVENLLELRYAVNDAILESALTGLDSGALPTMGTSDTVIYEFSDYQCGFCRRMFPALTATADSGKAKVALIEFPILGALSEKAARYALAAHQQGRYEQFHRLLMEGSGQITEHKIEAAAITARLDKAQLEKYINSADVEKQLEANYKLAVLLGIRGTPAFIINGQVYRGALNDENFNTLLEQP